MTASPRSFSVTYGTYVVGDTPQRTLTSEDSPIRIQEDEETWVLEFDWVLISTSEATFVTDTAAAEDAFRTPYQRLQVAMGGSTQYDFNPASGTNTGYNARPSIEKRGDRDLDSGRSRLYHVRIEIELPADQLGAADGRMGRRRSTVDISQDESDIRTLRLTGVYTAITGNSAPSQFAAQIDAFAAAVQSAIDSNAVWQIVGTPVLRYDDESDGTGFGKIAEFERTYREIPYREAQSSIDDASLVQQELRISPVKSAPGDAIGTIRLTRLLVTYRAAVKLSGSPRVSTPDLNATWENTVFPFLTSEVNKIATGAVVVASDPGLDFENSRIEATVEYQAAVGSVFERELTITDTNESGRVLLPLAGGEEDEYHEFKGPRKRTRIIIERSLVLGSVTNLNDPARAEVELLRESERTQKIAFRLPVGPASATQDSARSIVLRDVTTSVPKRLGTGEGSSPTLDLVEFTRTVEYQFFTEPGSGPAQGSGFNLTGVAGRPVSGIGGPPPPQVPQVHDNLPGLPPNVA